MKKQTEWFRINEQIKSGSVRIVGENIKPGIYEIGSAIQMATNLNCDLVEINRNVNPPVCKIVDYQKFLYDRKKQQKENDKKQIQQKLKEVRYTPVIGEHDYNFKLKQCIEFLNDKNKVKVSIFFQGRLIQHIDLGSVLMERIITDLIPYGKPENVLKMEGKRMIITFQPK